MNGYRWSMLAVHRELPLDQQEANTDKVILECRGVTMAFGGNIAVDNVDLTVRQGEIIGLVGTNGSGKTTLFNCISKVWEAKSGEITFDGAGLAGHRRDSVSRMGIGTNLSDPTAVFRSDCSGKHSHPDHVPGRRYRRSSRRPSRRQANLRHTPDWSPTWQPVLMP